MRTKAILIACAFCLMASVLTLAAQDNKWKLLETTTFGAGGFWENGQTVRIDRSYKPGAFSYERKVTSGQSLTVFSSKGDFSTLKNEYAPGETVTVAVSVSASGDFSAAPDQVYGRVTLLQGDPGWTRANWASQKIPGTGAVTGQLTASGGSYVASPAGIESLTFSGQAPASGNRMAIVFSCNGMDVLHLYGREGAAQQEAVEAPPTRKVNDDARTKDTSETVETADEEPAVKAKPAREKKVREKPEDGADGPGLQPLPPKIKLLILGALLLAAIFDLLYMFSKPKE